jgi:Domain of unknown function (DUF6265)
MQATLPCRHFLLAITEFVAFLLSGFTHLWQFCCRLKKIMMKTILTLVAIVTICCIPRPKTVNIPLFLAGNWKVDNREDYETWTATDATSMDGYASKIRQGQKIITEYLSIKVADGKTIYTALVQGQNNGQPVDFILNPEVTGKYSFENPEHDFPKKIQYTSMGSAAVLVEVSGEGGRGFSYMMTKQP